MKHLKHLFTALLLLCTTMATAHDFNVSGIYYNITDATNKTVEVTYRGDYYNQYSNEYTGRVVIPESVTYNGRIYSITRIGSHAFEDCSELTSITIPNSVTRIGFFAVSDCTGLKSITIPNSVTIIEDYAFADCTRLTSITIPNSVTSIGWYAFAGCTGLKSITISNSVTSIEEGAFKSCSGLTSITIPNSVTRIEDHAFRDCTRLTSITIPNSVTSIGSSAFRDCTRLTSITIPNSVTSIGSSAFKGCTWLTSIEIPNSVRSIGDNAFYGCTGLKTVINFSNLTFSKGSSSYGYVAYYANEVVNGSMVDDFAFLIVDGVHTLVAYLGTDNEITLPADYNGESYIIGDDAFYGNTTITRIEIPNSVTRIGDYAFNGCSGLTSITIPNSVTSIGNYAFYGCTGLKSITIPNSVTSIGSGVFEGCTGLTSITIPNSVTSIGSSAFYGCDGLTSITIPNSVTSIGEMAFYGCTGLTSITIPNSLTSIGDYAFYSCTGLTSIVIPNSVTSIGIYAFCDCSGLKTVYNFSNPTFSKGSSDYGYVAYYADKVYNIPEGFIENDFVLGKVNSVNTLVGYLGNATKLTLPADYKCENYVIDIEAFKGNKTIKSIVIPNSVTSIGEEAFSGCTGLEKVCINDLVAWCGIDFGSADANPLYYAGNLYLNGKLLTDISIPTEVEKVKDYAFYNCNGVTNIDIVDGVKSIGSNAFYGCSNLETLYISNTIESIGDYAFAECNNILDIKIGSKKAITASENIFSSDAYNNACLYVPNDRKDFYAKTSPWRNFIIREMDFTGIEDVEAEGEWIKDVYYDLSGRVVENPSSGIYIINGKKVVIK